MADPIEGANPSPASTPADGQSAAAAPSGTGDTSAAAPWGGKFESPEKLWDSYGSLEKKLGEQGGLLGEYKKAYEALYNRYNEYENSVREWDRWYKDNLAPHWERIKGIINGQQQGQAQQGQAGQATAADYYRDWGNLQPHEQAQRMQYAVAQGLVQGLVPQLKHWQENALKQMNDTLAQREQYYNNYLTLYRKVMDMRMADPSLDIDSVLDNAVRLMSGQQDPIDVGKTLATMGLDKEAYAKKAVEQAKRDWEQEQKNKQMATVQPAAGRPPVFKNPATVDTRRGLSGLRESVVQKVLEKHGPSVFTPPTGS